MIFTLRYLQNLWQAFCFLINCKLKVNIVDSNFQLFCCSRWCGFCCRVHQLFPRGNYQLQKLEQISFGTPKMKIFQYQSPKMATRSTSISSVVWSLEVTTADLPYTMVLENRSLPRTWIHAILPLINVRNHMTKTGDTHAHKTNVVRSSVTAMFRLNWY